MVFLTGIYGSGKSTLCDRLCSTSTIQYIRASDLIYREKHTLPPTNKRINQVNENQQYLIQALQKLSFTQTPILLEGHSCLLNKQLAVERISPDVFQQMNISAIILLMVDIHRAQKGCSAVTIRHIRSLNFQHCKRRNRYILIILLICCSAHYSY